VRKVQGWIVKPIGFERGKQYPMLLEIHGGPHGMYSVGFDYMWQTWPRTVRGALHQSARQHRLRQRVRQRDRPGLSSVDYDDLMAAWTACWPGYVDQSRMYVAGCSGGGVLSSWVIGHTDRFAGAAVAVR
jgi:dipeptidyl aminopeptidase/acylaminoacyl peptidase